MKTIALLILTFLATSGFAQRNNQSYELYIKAFTAYSINDFTITIKKAKRRTKIIYAKNDGINHVLVSQDKEFERVSKLYFESNYFDDPNSSKGKEYSNQFEKLMQRYFIYTKDSLNFKNKRNLLFIQLLDTFFSESKYLENKEELRKDDVLNWARIQLIMKSKEKGEVNFLIESLSPDTHPQTYKLVRESLNLYRNNRPNSFMDKQYTGFH